MYKRIDATPFNFSLEDYKIEFEKILRGITACYKMMLKNNIILTNDENSIRDILIKDYLNNRQIRDKIGFTGRYNFNREVPEDNDMGRVDIKITTQNTLEEPEAYYIIECKRLDNQNLMGDSGLNAKYITDGIKRFIEIKYSVYCRINGMIGFVVEQMDIHANIENINNLLQGKFSNLNTETFLTFHEFIENFEYQYYSKHKDIKFKKFKLYHLMFDFSANMKEEKADIQY